MSKTPRYTWIVTDQAAGRYTLPGEVTAAWSEWCRLAEHTIPQPAEVDPVSTAAAELRRAARGESPLLTRVPGLTMVEAEAHAARAAQRALDQAQTEARLDFEAQVIEHLEVIVRDHLAPVHAELVDEARQLWPKIAHLTTPAEAVRGDEQTRTAWLRVEALAIQFGVILDVASRANQAGETVVQHPELAKHYSTVRDPATAWPDFNRLQHQVRAGSRPRTPRSAASSRWRRRRWSG